MPSHAFLLHVALACNHAPCNELRDSAGFISSEPLQGLLILYREFDVQGVKHAEERSIGVPKRLL